MDQVLIHDIETIAIPTLDKLLPGWRNKYQTGLNKVRREILLNMAFNMGLPTLAKFKKMWAAIKLQDWEEAAKQMLDSKWAKQVGYRANELADAMRTGQWSKSKGAA